MPQFAAFAINDGSTTPVSITYALENIASGTVHLVDRRLGTSMFQPRIQSAFDAPSKARPKSTKIQRSFSLPHVRVVGGVDTLIGVSRAVVTYYLDVNATSQEVKHLEAMVNNTGVQTQMSAQVRDQEPFYS